MNGAFQIFRQKIYHNKIINFIVFGIIFLLGLGLRLYKLSSQSLWYDEARSVFLAKLPFFELNADIIEHSWNHPPLYFYLLKVWLLIFGFDDFRARLLSVVFGLLTVLFIYYLAWNIFDKRAGYFAAFLLAISQIGIMYSQEARPYSQFVFLVVITLYLFILALKSKKVIYWWGLVCSAILMLYTNYYSLIVLLVLLLFCLIYHDRYKFPMGHLVAGGFLICLSFVPWLSSGVVGQILKNSTSSDSQPIWFSVGKFEFVDAINAFNNGLSEGLLNSPAKWTYFIGGLLFTLPALIALIPLIQRKKNNHQAEEKEYLVLLLMLWLLPIVVIQIVSKSLDIQYDTRYILFSIIPYYILVARGLTSIKYPVLLVGIIVIILGYSLYSLNSNYFKPYKENYRDALRYLAERYKTRDCVAFLPYNQLPLQWALYQGDNINLKLVEVEEATKNDCERIWVVAYRRVQSAKKDVKEKLDFLDPNYQRIDESKYLFVHVYLYEQR